MCDNEGVFLGIDTSNYTTSVAVCTQSGEVIANIKRPLPVEKGQRGLRQSDAVFHHTASLPDALREASEYLNGKKLLAVGASERPRDAKGSYMPCFLAGKSAAVAAASAAGVPYFDFSHQCGHIMAALYSAEKTELIGKSFAAFHISGGTTDILLAKPDSERVFNIERVGGTLDINAGQAIDRAGVMMGLSFPCGAALEKLALSYGEKPDTLRISVNGLSCNLSGLENKAEKLYRESENEERVALFVIEFITKTLEKLTENLKEKYPGTPIIYAGGVSSCSIIKKRLSVFGSFASPAFSSDNAAGVALLTRLKYMK